MATDDRWEGALREAFEGASVLERIESTAGSVSRILLRDPGGDETPVLRVAAAEEARAYDHRYTVVGEIARGGVGVILKGHDRDLGRDVALKVLRDEYTERDDILDRFVEEAQVTGQLQHPGIVPVYGLGVQADGRPYFAMKLVKGATLSALLQEREHVTDRRSFFVTLFERICQTVGYAHSRGVIHRDLKPANIMVGAFGEAQVMDWGFAKVLGRADAARDRSAEATIIATVRSGEDGSHSLAGSVMGTPAYMPPEQALGQVDDLDERADVFSLGAILCEILTGSPPYIGEPRDLLPMAARGDTTDACKRLDATDAPEPLVDLAKRCLATASTGRPRNANRLARRTAVQLARQEEQARRAEVAAAQARAAEQEERAKLAAEKLAAEEKRAAAAKAKAAATKANARAAAARRRTDAAAKARRGSITIAALLLVAVVLGGGAYLWNESDARERERTREATARAAIREAMELEGSERWSGALVAIEGAQETASTPATLTRAKEIRSRIELRKREADAAADLAKRDREFVRRIEEHREQLIEQSRLRKHGMASVFAQFGIDLEELDVEESARRIREYPSRGLLVAELYGDAVARRLEYTDHRLSWQKYVAIAEAVEPPDRWRWLREFLDTRDRKALLAFAANVDVAATEERVLLLVADTLRRFNEPRAAAELLERALLTDPDSIGLLWTLAIAYMEGADIEGYDPARHAQVTAAACALRPRSPYLRGVLARIHAWRGDTDLALATVDDALRLDPTSLMALCSRAWILVREGDADAAKRISRRAIRIAPTCSTAHAQLARIHAVDGDIPQAIRHMDEAIKQAPQWPWYHSAKGFYLSRRYEFAQAAQSYRRACELAPNAVIHWLTLCWACERARDAAGLDWAAKQLAQRFPLDARSYIQLGISSLRRRNVTEAIALAEKAIQLDPHVAGAHRLLSSAYSIQGDWRVSLEHGMRVARLNPTAFSFQHLAWLLMRAGYPQRSLDAARTALQYAPKDPYCMRALANSLALTGRYEEAVALCEAGIDAGGADILFLASLVAIHVENDNAAAAAAALEEGLRLGNPGGDAESVLLTGMLTDVRLREGRFSESADALRSFLDGTAQLSLMDDPATADDEVRRRQLLNYLTAAAPFEERVPEIASGKIQPTSQDQRIGFAYLCAYRDSPAAAARLFEEAHAAPGGLRFSYWNDAAAAAIRAGREDLAGAWLDRLLATDPASLDGDGAWKLRNQVIDWRRDRRLIPLHSDSRWQRFEALYRKAMES